MGSKILLADDSITIQKVVNLTFADEGIDVVSVSNGDQAERRLAEVDPDLVLADIFMPGKNGYELCEVIKRSPQFANVPVVLLVGAFEPFNEAEARRVKADAHLTKPFESRVLVETVRQLIDKNPRPKSAPVTTQVVHGERMPEPPPQLNARPMPMPAIDLSAMSTPFHSQETVLADRPATGSLADSTPFADSFPNNFGYQNQGIAEKPPQVDMLANLNSFTADSHPVEMAQEANPIEISVPTEQNSQANYAELFNTPPAFQTQEMAVPLEPQSDSTFDIFDIPEPLDGTTTKVLGSFNISDSVAEKTYAAASDVVVDLDKPAAIETPQAEVLPTFEVMAQEPVSPLPKGSTDNLALQEAAPSAQAQDTLKAQPQEAAVAQAQEVVVAQAEDATVKKFDTNELEPPQHSFGASVNDLAPSANHASEVLQADKDFSIFEASLAQDHSSSTLLSADDPLGDVLYQEFPQETFAPQPQPEVAPLEFEGSVAIPSQTETTYEVAQPETIADTSDFEFKTAESSLILPEPQLQPEQQTVATEVVPQQNTAPAPVEAEAEQGFQLIMPEKVTPIHVETALPNETAFNFYTEPEQTDAPMPMEAAETAAPIQDSAEIFATSETTDNFTAAAQQTPEVVTPEEKFTASDMWTSENPFTPAAMQTVPATDSPTNLTQDIAEIKAAENGSAVMQPQIHSPSLSASTTEAALQKDANHLEETTHKEVEMNKEMMDEIVRRVVAELSDTVVREIAWEVVPDCVERVVSNLTREDLAKRL
jgi:CheY-like chemotaxis protein